MKFNKKWLSMKTEIEIREFAKDYVFTKIGKPNVYYYDSQPINEFANAVYLRYLEDEKFGDEIIDSIIKLKQNYSSHIFKYGFTEGFENNGYYYTTKSVYDFRRSFKASCSQKLENELDNIYKNLNYELEK